MSGSFEGYFQQQGLIEYKAPANPAAGADLIYTIPTNQRLRIQAVSFVFTADGNAANRTISVQVMTNEGTPVIVFEVNHDTAITATQVDRVSLGDGLPRDHTGGVILMPFPANLVLLQGMQIRTTIANIQVGDQISAVRLLVERWIEE